MPLWILSLLKSRLTWYALTAVAVFGIITLQTQRLHAARSHVEKLDTELTSVRQQLDATISANQTNQTTIDTLQKRIQVMVDERTLDKAKQDALLAQREDQLAKAVKDAANERKKREQAWTSSTSCQSLGSVRVDAVCSDIADRLRDRSAGSAVDTHGGGPG